MYFFTNASQAAQCVQDLKEKAHLLYHGENSITLSSKNDVKFLANSDENQIEFADGIKEVKIDATKNSHGVKSRNEISPNSFQGYEIRPSGFIADLDDHSVSRSTLSLPAGKVHLGNHSHLGHLKKIIKCTN